MTGNPVAGVSHVGLLDALAIGPERWDALVASSPVASPFMSWAWHEAWAQSATSEALGTSFALLIHDRTGCLQGVLPLSVQPARFRRMRVMSLTWATAGVGSPDHLDIPTISDPQLEAALPFVEALPWDVILFGGVAQEATNIARLSDAFARRGFAVRRTPSDACPYIELPGTWDEYLASLSRSRRQTIRRKERKLRREHEVTVTDYAPDRLGEGWDHLRALHEQRWAGPGTFDDPQIEALLRRFSTVQGTRRQFWLTTLDVDGEPAAAWCGFAWGDCVYFYQCGRALKWSSDSVGQVLMGTMIRRAIERGYRCFDFLRGRDAYKLSWTSTERAIYDVVVFRPGWRGAQLRGLDMAGRLRARLRSRSQWAGAVG